MGLRLQNVYEMFMLHGPVEHPFFYVSIITKNSVEFSFILYDGFEIESSFSAFKCDCKREF